MNRKLLRIAILCGFLALPLLAHADVMDDFTLVGDGYTITFSEPAVGVTPDHPHGVYLTDPISAIINGNPGNTGNVQILANPLPGLPSLVFSLPGFPVYALYGPLINSFAVLPIGNPTPDYPDNLQLTLDPGLYSLLGEDTSTSQFADFSLNIAPESSTLTPEPGTLALLSTALAAGGLMLRRRFIHCKPA